jgi:hypothetical protein
MNHFTLQPANKFIWNQTEFIQFLANNVGQPITISTNLEGPCLTACGVYTLLEQFNYKEVKIKTSNYLEQHPVFQIEYELPFAFFQVSAPWVSDPPPEPNYSNYHYWNQKKLFGCFYNRPLWHRIGLAATLQHDYSDQTLLNVRCNPKNQDQRQLFEIDDLFFNSPDSFTKFAKVVNTWPCQIEEVDGYTLRAHGYFSTLVHTDQLVNYYPDFLIDIVGETWITGRTFFLTEKTIRSMLLKKPMIVMGSAGTLMYLRQMGFKTFWEFWDENYDGYSDRDRYNKIVELIGNIATKSPGELEDMYNRMEPILEHNYNLLLKHNYKKEFNRE